MKFAMYTLFGSLVVLMLVLTACGTTSTPPASPTVDISLVYTQAAQTAYAQLTQTALFAPPTSTNTPTPAETNTPRPTNTPLITDTPSGALSPTPFPTFSNVGGGGGGGGGGGEVYDDAVYVDDVTIPDGTEVSPGATFVKTWRVRNTGISTWTPQYAVIYGWASDNWKSIKNNPPAPAPIGQSVAPGEEVDVSITIKAPVESGYYQATFRLRNDKGYNFGEWLTVVIKVKGTPVPPTATP